MNLPGSALLGPADSWRDYEALTSGWALGTAFQNQRDFGPLGSTFRSLDQQQAAGGTPIFGFSYFMPIPGERRSVGPESALLDPADANKRYGISGALSWSVPVREEEAKLLNAWKQEELRQADILARSSPGAVPATARFLAGLAGGNADPLGFGSNFVPVLQEARWAQLGARIGYRGMRLIRGAAEGAAGTLVTEPLVYGQAVRQQADYGFEDSALNFAFGVAGGSGLHFLGGEAGDLLKRWRSAPIEIRDAAMNQAAAALVTGTPVRTAEILGTVTPPETLKAAALKVGDRVFTGQTHADAFDAAIAAGISEDALGLANRDSGFVTSTGRYVGREDALSIAQESGQKYRRVGNSVTSQGTTAPTAEEIRAGKAPASEAKAQDVIAFVQSKGGIRDTEGHDLRNAVGQRQNPRYGALLREKGNTIDEIGEMLWEGGYFGDPRTSPRPTEAQVVDLLREASGRKIYSELANVEAGVDAGHARDLANEELGRVAEETGVRVSDVEKSAALDLMLGRGLSASDALDQVLERTAIEGGTFATTAQRVADVERRIAAMVEGNAPLSEIAPLMDERMALQEDLARERMPAVGETIRADLRGDAPGSLDAMGLEASRGAAQDAKDALPIEEAVEQARAARVNAEAHFKAVSGGADLDPAELRAMNAEIETLAAKRQAALSLAGCMIREGV
ncbi:hypothetical protein [Dongia sp. agr-C8]